MPLLDYFALEQYQSILKSHYNIMKFVSPGYQIILKTVWAVQTYKDLKIETLSKIQIRF